MNRRTFLAGLSGLFPLGATAFADDPTKSLIEQLGSKKFKEREAASRALAKAGGAAIPALRRAAMHHPDAEVRRRAALLVAAYDVRHLKEQVQKLLQSKLSDADKEIQLKALMPYGAPPSQVEQVLGPYESHYIQVLGNTLKMEWYYGSRSVTIRFRVQGERVGVSGIRVHTPLSEAPSPKPSRR